MPAEPFARMPLAAHNTAKSKRSRFMVSLFIQFVLQSYEKTSKRQNILRRFVLSLKTTR
jgi:hypothetical protein